ncbi:MULTISPECIES: substrate-binding and VWA domain-containing protein [unclassified Pseudofrankia]|uniref:substrate-binding and VWA domain-containing protein n=1 Tax=unclassified Pseudofrankia TaxID=2994372 RepID=UPI0008D99D49|nr:MULTISPECIES: substrate-binding and VWA domain-containing protein [unclassified Pseudofrankia]MDT3444122.1 substrate-binding and VWA domain-containing protein [Pseudofrankia sp. BMG5.37]OHV44446.1 VWA domain-containing protein [Pseudofrankia sp. BMG5.36]
MTDARHRPRHRGAGERSTGRAKILIPALVVLLLAGGGYVASTRLLGGNGSDAGCQQTMLLTVRTGSSLTTALTQAATGYNGQRHQVLGKCVRVKVETVDSGQTASAIAAGWTDAAYGSAPDVWVPESADWVALARTGAASAKMLGADGTTVASSPVVLAMPRPMATALGWPGRQLSWSDLRANEGSASFWADRGHPEWGAFKIGIPSPETSSAGLAAVLNVVASNVGQPASALTAAQFAGDLNTKGAILTFERGTDLVAESDTDLVSAYIGWGKDAPAHMSALVLPESLVYQVNMGTGVVSDDTTEAALPGGQYGHGPADVPLVAAYPTDGLVVDEATYQPLALPAGSDRATAAQDFLADLTGPSGQATLAAAGYRSPDRTNSRLTEKAGLVPALRTTPRTALDGQTIDGARRTFLGIHQRGNTLAVLDTSGSMDLVVPGSGGKTRLQIAVAAANAAVPLFAKDSRLGLWQFSTGLDGAKPYRELVPVGLMSDAVADVPREQALLTAISGMSAKGSTGLYATALAAFRALSAQYEPEKPNQVVLLTDGQNEDKSSTLTLAQLIQTLKDEYDPKRPVHIITIGYGADADQSALRQISEATGSKTYPAQDPNSIFQVMVNALTDR